MVRPECYQCASCGKPWSAFYPKVTCACGCDVLRLKRSAQVVVLDVGDIADGDVELSPGPWPAFAPLGPWSPYPIGNGEDGVINGE